MRDGFDPHLCQVVCHHDDHDGLVGGCVILVEVPLARFEEFWPLAAKSLPELSQNLHVMLLVDHLALGDEVDVDNTLAVKERDHHELPNGSALSGLLGQTSLRISYIRIFVVSSNIQLRTDGEASQ